MVGNFFDRRFILKFQQDKVTRIIRLPNCDPDTESGTDIYEYVEAQSCKCQVCSQERANCMGHAPDQVGRPNFPGVDKRFNFRQF